MRNPEITNPIRRLAIDGKPYTSGCACPNCGGHDIVFFSLERVRYCRKCKTKSPAPPRF